MKIYPLKRSRSINCGFALAATICVMALLLLIAIGILSLSTIEVRSSHQDAAMFEARANARMALMLAIGQLQTTMGPDTRISARAELLANDARVGVSVSPNTPRAWWVGVSSSDPTESVGTSSTDQKVEWLVSGLDPQDTTSDQISSAQPFADPVPMFGDYSIHTSTLTGGYPIEAGKIRITNGASLRQAKAAWFIDDNGMKAQLAASRFEVDNKRPEPYGEGVIPGTYDLGILEDMGNLAGRTPAEINRLLSTNNLPLLGAQKDIARKKRMSYTTLSRGILSDVSNGGLKKDLTIAFENEDVFDTIWGNGYDADNNKFEEDYIVMNPEKFALCDDLQTNGYIHFEMFKDFYNIKQHIERRNGFDSLPVSVYSLAGLGYTGSADGKNYPEYRDGRLGPHQIGNATTKNGRFYGDYGKNGNAILEPVDHYKHSPLVPVIQRMQQNAWLERIDIEGEPHVRTNVQIWLAQYNPYNIGLYNPGPYARGFSPVNFEHNRLWVERSPGGVQEWMTGGTKYDGFYYRTQLTSPAVMLAPGRAHVMAIQKDNDNASEGDDKGYYKSGTFGENVKDLTMESSYKDYKLFPDRSSPGSLAYKFYRNDAFTQGGTSNRNFSASVGNKHWWTVSQTLWAPYSWDKLNSKKISEDNVGVDDLNENTMGCFAFRLRTTREPATDAGPVIRPLVDANIRALLGNGRWDSPLGLNLLAAYSPENECEVDEQIMQMNVRDAPKGYAYWGGGRELQDSGYDRVILFDIPRKDLVSLGQLQHANVGRFSYEPSYVIGNSYTNLRIPQDDWRASASDTLFPEANKSIAGTFNLYDASYLTNEVIWDSYIFTTIPQVADNYGPDTEEQPDDTHFEKLRNHQAFLPNPRFLPYKPAGSQFDKETLQDNPNAFYHNAGHIIVDGSFNVNSTSVDAWEAFLSSTHQLPYQKIDENGIVTGFVADAKGVRFPRLFASFGGPMESKNLNENFWTGFRSLTQEEIRELATEIVKEIRKRGPFLTMGEFVNRKLVSGDQGQCGALQAALDNTVNKDIDSNFTAGTNHPGIPDNSTQASGFPGQLLQGDILQALSPFMTVRSDTFTIRAYGESLSPDGSKVLARAWCEATVQRFPDPVHDSTSGDLLTELTKPSSRFGRRFRITSFRWLNENEI